MRFDSLQAWLDWQETLHASKIELGLGRVAEVYHRLHEAAPPFCAITVAGTNGKGSSAAMLAEILRAAGYCTGLYSSPHLFRYNERIRIDGEAATDESICDAFERVDQARGDVTLTYFEFGTLAALDLFMREGLDVAVLEVGMGGRLDAVNIVDPDVALITAIGVDHTDWLGSDRESIAREKGGIMRPGCPAVCSDPHVPRALEVLAASSGTELYQLGKEYGFSDAGREWSWWCEDLRYESLPHPALRGAHQLQNAAGVLMALKLVAGRLPVPRAAVRAGLLAVQLPGRFEVVSGEVTRVLDVAHNPDGARALAAALAGWSVAGKTRAVVGVLADKDISGLLAPMLAQVDAWYLADLNVARGASADDLAHALAALDVETLDTPVQCFPGPHSALRAAAADSDSGDRIVVFGSFHTVEACAGSEAGILPP
ncbi:MAG: bifunctional tetrahydrofolate synthase/dihydrofolate synthase [Pseudomonadota bacterium]|nr:MAG: bifunctional tetrahydrofolate synthase/dihydrofolate synthase [Pseudomonadota bacterium]